MTDTYTQPPINPYEQNYTSSFQYRMPDSQQENPQWSQPQDLPIYIVNNSNSNLISQPLINTNESIDSFTEMRPAQNNQTENCETHPCVKVFVVLELLCDIVGLLIYFFM